MFVRFDRLILTAVQCWVSNTDNTLKTLKHPARVTIRMFWKRPNLRSQNLQVVSKHTFLNQATYSYTINMPGFEPKPLGNVRLENYIFYFPVNTSVNTGNAESLSSRPEMSSS